MCKICPKCGAIAEYNAYYGRTICTSCSWESDKSSKYIRRVQSKSKLPTNHRQSCLIKNKG